jgi:hypothetical protein
VKSGKDKPEPESTDPSNRRRVGRVVHDDRGQGSVQWYDAPEDFNLDRPKLEIQESAAAPAGRQKSRRDDHRLAIAPDKRPGSFNPYQRAGVERDAKPAPGGKRDLRQLSKWIKLMKELEERKALDRDAPDSDSED